MAESCQDVVQLGEVERASIEALFEGFGLALQQVADGDPIPATFWGEPEAGIAGRTVFARRDTPVHSLLHEAAHVICMSPSRRARVYRDAGGNDLEESAVCYLEILLAERLPEVGGRRLMEDMDRWGYSFRLGSTGRWFSDDAEDARAFLLRHGIIDKSGKLTGRCRGEQATGHHNAPAVIDRPGNS